MVKLLLDVLTSVVVVVVLGTSGPRNRMISITCSHEERMVGTAGFAARTSRAAVKSEKWLVLRNGPSNRAPAITVGYWDPGGATTGRIGLRFEGPRNGKDLVVFCIPGFALTGFLVGAEKVKVRFPAEPIGISDCGLVVRQRDSSGVFAVSGGRAS